MATFYGIARPHPARRLSGLAEPADVVRPDDGRAYVAIDTGYAMHPVEDTDAWGDEFELADDGTFGLFVWDGTRKRAHLIGKIIDGSAACALLEKLGVVSAVDCAETQAYDQGILSIEYVRVVPEYRGRRYAVMLLEAAVKYFGRRTYTYADVFSGRIYRSFRAVLPRPMVAVAYDLYEDPSTPTQELRNPTDEQVLAALDENPREGTNPYQGGFQLDNDLHVQLLWR